MRARLLLFLFLCYPLPAIAQNPCAASAIEASNAFENYRFQQAQYRSIFAPFLDDLVEKKNKNVQAEASKKLCPSLQSLIDSIRDFLRADSASRICYAGIGVSVDEERTKETREMLRQQMERALGAQAGLCMAP